MANDISVDCMIIEAGIIANCVTPNTIGAALSERIATEAGAAWDDSQTHLSIGMSPFEAGLVLDGLSRSQDAITGDIGNRILAQLNALMAELNVPPIAGEPTSSGAPAPAAGMDPSAAPSDNPPTSDSDTEPTESTQSAPAADPTPSTDSSAPTDSTTSTTSSEPANDPNA